MKHTYATPAQVGTNVRSVAQSRFGAIAVNSRFTRSGCRADAGSGRVVFTRFDRRAPSILAARIRVGWCWWARARRNNLARHISRPSGNNPSNVANIAIVASSATPTRASSCLVVTPSSKFVDVSA